MRGNRHCHARPPRLSFRATAEESQRCGRTVIATPGPLVCHSERQPRNPNRTGEPSLPRPTLLFPSLEQGSACSGCESWLMGAVGIPRLSLGMTGVAGLGRGCWLMVAVGIPRLSLGMTGVAGLGWEGWLMVAVGIPRLSLGMTGVAGLGWDGWLMVAVGIPRLSLGMTGLVGLGWVGRLMGAVGIPRLLLGMTGVVGSGWEGWLMRVGAHGCGPLRLCTRRCAAPALPPGAVWIVRRN